MIRRLLMMPDFRTGPLYQENLAKGLLNEGIKVIFPFNLKNFPFLLPILRNVLKSKITVLHMHWIDGYSGFGSNLLIKAFYKYLLFKLDVYLVKYILKTKIVWTIHNLYSHEIYYPQIEKLSRRFFSKKVDAVICHCKYAKNSFQEEFRVNKNKIYVIPIGNYINSYKNEISKEEARKRLNLKMDDFIFLNIGSIRPYKGIVNLIKNFKKFAQKKNVKLLIVGRPTSNSYEKQIIKSSKDISNIELHFKFISNDEIQTYLNASDVVVFSYRKILTSAGILLAMSFGKPIITPRIGCISEVLDEKGAFLYNPQDKDGLFNVLEKAFDNKDKLEEKGKCNLNLAKKFEWNIIAKKTRKIFDRFL